MQITRTDVDALNAKIAISIEQNDFTQKVDEILKDYRKNANIPGFRKGHVPMGMNIYKTKNWNYLAILCL